jgi:DNA polymerase-3 subunit epsilon
MVDSELAALDFETTGLEVHRGHRVIEVAVVRGRRGEEPARWSTLVHPQRPVEATPIHGLSDGDLALAPPYAQVAHEVERRLGGAVLVAHNLPFELAFLAEERRRCGVEGAVAGGFLDSLVLARNVLRLDRHGLGSVLRHLGIAHARPHRALDDALGTWHATWELLRRADPGDTLTIEQATALSRRPLPADRQALALHLREQQGRTVWIEYAGQGLTRRAITPTHVTGQRVHAWCHLRQAERRFRLDRIRVVDPHA